MTKLVHNISDVSFAVLRLPDRKKPVLCLMKGDTAVKKYAIFDSEDKAEEFVEDMKKWLSE